MDSVSREPPSPTSSISECDLSPPGNYQSLSDRLPFGRFDISAHCSLAASWLSESPSVPQPDFQPSLYDIRGGFGRPVIWFGSLGEERVITQYFFLWEQQLHLDRRAIKPNTFLKPRLLAVASGAGKKSSPAAQCFTAVYLCCWGCESFKLSWFLVVLYFFNL